MNVNKFQRQVANMNQKQTIQIPVDNHTSVILELYVLRSHNHLSGYESMVGTLCKDRIREVRIRPHIWIIRALNVSVSIVLKAISWLNQLGRYEIDAKRMENSYNHYIGLRIRGMDR